MEVRDDGRVNGDKLNMIQQQTIDGTGSLRGFLLGERYSSQKGKSGGRAGLIGKEGEDSFTSACSL